MSKETFVVNGMTCASCVANVENAVNNLDGVDKAVVNLTTEKMSVDYSGNKVSPEAIEKAVADAGYEAQVYNPDTAKSQEEREEVIGLHHSSLLSSYGANGRFACAKLLVSSPCGLDLCLGAFDFDSARYVVGSFLL